MSRAFYPTTIDDRRFMAKNAQPLAPQERRLRTIARLAERNADPYGADIADPSTIRDVENHASGVGGEWAARARGLR